MLAAGAATRMGTLKQLLPFRGRPMILHVISEAHAAGFSPVIVVVGAQAFEVRACLDRSSAHIAENPDWQTGMGSSIACGMRSLLQAADAEAVAILLADQPLITAEHLKRMGQLLNEKQAAVAAEYNGSLGVPAMFCRNLFPALLALAPEAGAKQLLRGLGDRVAAFPLSEAAHDIDTPDDYARLV